jgi:predicted nucleic acid-binding protein
VILLDTNVVSDGLKVHPNPNVEKWLDAANEAEVWISAITVAELRVGVEMMDDGKRKAELRQAVDDAIDEFGGACISFDALAAYEYAHIVATRRRQGRPIEPLDAQLAAIAVTAGLTLATLNTKDFEGIEGLKLVDPSQ